MLPVVQTIGEFLIEHLTFIDNVRTLDAYLPDKNLFK